MNFFKKIFIPNGQKEPVTAYETWVVRWRSRYGQYVSDTQDECEIFTTKEDAEKFAIQLKEAFKLIKHSSGNRVEVSKN